MGNKHFFLCFKHSSTLPIERSPGYSLSCLKFFVFLGGTPRKWQGLHISFPQLCTSISWYSQVLYLTVHLKNELCVRGVMRYTGLGMCKKRLALVQLVQCVSASFLGSVATRS